MFNTSRRLFQHFVLGASLTVFGFASTSALAAPAPTPAPARETAILAAGCFWGVEEYFRKMDGVFSTRVGYVGGTKVKPSYEEVSAGQTGHAEAVEIVFDPKKVSFETLLERFFKMHDPTTLNRQGNDVGTQYRSAIFVSGESQKQLASKMIERVNRSKAWKSPLTTEIKDATTFYAAEDYHQKYLVKNPDGYDNHFVRKISF